MSQNCTAAKLEWVSGSVGSSPDWMDQISFLLCCKASSCLVRGISSLWLCFCKSRRETIVMRTTQMFANIHRWIILLKYFFFCPSFLRWETFWNPRFPVHKKFYFKMKTWVKEVVLKHWCRVFAMGRAIPRHLVTAADIPLTSFLWFFFLKKLVELEVFLQNINSLMNWGVFLTKLCSLGKLPNSSTG